MIKNLQYQLSQWFSIAISIALVLGLVAGAVPFYQKPQPAEAADFTMQTGYYIGTGTDNLAITGLGFQPQFVMIKDHSTNGNDGVNFKTSSMAGEVSSVLADPDADTASNAIQSLDSDGFTVGTDADVNTAGVYFHWVAFGGSDCSSSGTFCVGTYTGNGTSSVVTSVGFQPNLVMIKRSGASQGVWKSSSMATNTTQFFTNANEIGSGTNTHIRTLDATGFTTGSDATVNTSANTYRYIAFKNVTDKMAVGTYTGNATDGRDITGFGASATPDMAFVKAANATTAVSAVFNVTETYGDYSQDFNDAASAVNHIQILQADGFDVGTTNNVNGNTFTYYWAAFGGASDATGSGNFSMANGTYTGNGTAVVVSGLGFQPDLVIIKANTALQAVFKTKLMNGTRYAYMSGATADVTLNGITLTSDGFTVGSDLNINTNGTVFQYHAFGNAFDPHDKSGASNFAIGAIMGNGIDSRDISRVGISPDFVTIKRSGASAGVFRTSAMAGDLTGFFVAGTAESANFIQSLGAQTFQIGTNAAVNTAAAINWWFAFDETPGLFDVGSYAGTGINDLSITGVGSQPDLVWVKRTSNTASAVAVMRPSSLEGDTTQYFAATANATNRVDQFHADGFRVDANVETNAAASTFRYVAWNAKQYRQEDYRLFANADSTDVGAALAAENTPATLTSSGQQFRLRQLIRVTNGNLHPSGKEFKLQYVDPGVGTCALPIGGTPAIYTEVTTSTLISYYGNTTPADGDNLTDNANDPADGSRANINQDYEESNNFTTTVDAVMNELVVSGGEDGLWDFALYDNGAAADTEYCFRIIGADNKPINGYDQYASITTSSGGTLSVDIVDSGGSSVTNPALSLSEVGVGVSCQTTTGVLGVTNEKIRVTNGTGSPNWTLSIAATGGSGTFWGGGGPRMDFNDPTSSGCADGGDADLYGGQMTIDPSGAAIAPEGGCSNTDVSQQSLELFDEGTTDDINIAVAGGSADTDCYWDITDIDLSQKIPSLQPAATYGLNMTLSIVAI